MTAQIHNFYDSAAGRITDPVSFLAADADIKAQVLRLWAADNGRHALTFADKVDSFLNDAQVGYAFLTPQLYRIETEVYMTRYPSFDFGQFMSIDTSGDMWDIGTIVYSQDDVGQAEYLAGAAFDMPYASSRMSQFNKPYHLAGIGYEWNTQELQRAAKLGRSLPSDKARAAKRAADRFLYGIALNGKTPRGDAEKGGTGFVNNASAPSAQVANDGTGPSRLWSAKTPDLILRDINEALTAVETGTSETSIADTLILPTTRYNYIATTPRASGSDMTILSFLLANNVAGAEPQDPQEPRARNGRHGFLDPPGRLREQPRGREIPPPGLASVPAAVPEVVHDLRGRRHHERRRRRDPAAQGGRVPRQLLGSVHMAKVTNISNGPRGAYNEGVLVMADPGETIEADDFAKEWFANASSAAAKDAAEEAAAPEEAPAAPPAKSK
jgi:hypothetical protein